MTTYVPENQRDTAWYIWNKLFMCRVPYLQSMSPDYVRHFGVPMSGDPVRDKAIVSEKITTMLTIAQMVEYFSKGVTVGVVKHADTSLIYQYISDHLNAWRQQLEVGLNNRDAPLDDLLAMDRFASAVYVHAKQHFDDEFVEGIIARRMRGAMRVNRTNLFLRRPGDPKPVPGEEPQAPAKPERNSMAEVFASRRATVKGGKSWK